ncbi:prostatic acid phosphatase-like isoform X1 [Asterias amurensis]|uniref:prostatic acid phosphatase-like isoform X1 n=1 Tax=Asterias amurensis TaxID=7602 RepID=UPI003AB3A820
MAACNEAFSKLSMWCLLIVFSLLCSLCSTERSLKMTHVLFRHGNRSPIAAYPSDPYQEDSWPQGFGQLTQKGMRQHYELGQWFRKRYSTFLNSSYVRTEISVRSTGYDRTIMSALSNLAGLYPPSNKQIWNQELLWQPIPVFSVPKEDDFLLSIDHTPCPRYNEILAEAATKKNNYLSKHKSFLQSIAKYCGFDSNPVSFKNYSRVADTTFFEREDGRKLPDWATPDVIQKLFNVINVYYTIESQMGDEFLRLGAGPILNEIVGHLKNKTAGKETTKMFMYSAHDDNVESLLASLQVFNDLWPPTASCVIIELYQEDNKSFTIDVLFKNASNKEPEKLQMPGSSGPCTLDHFYKITKHLLLSDVKAACKSKKDHGGGNFLPETWNTGWTLLAIFTVLAILVAFVMVVSLCRNFQRSRRFQKARQMQPINFHLLGHVGTDSEDESVFDT